jgi:hypothetical protein
MFNRILSVLFLLLFITIHGVSQDIRINELLSSNSKLLDEFGGTPDWFELYNSGSQNIQLAGWGLSDTREPSGRWIFENTTLGPGGFLLVFASDRDIKHVKRYETVITEGDVWQYTIPDQYTDSNWKMPGFDASGWQTGSSGFGYGDGDDQTILASGTRAVFIRKTFNIEQPDNIIELVLHMDYDDAFVAFINGTEITRANIGVSNQNTPYYATPDTDHEAKMYSGQAPDRFDASAFTEELIEGENVLAIQLHNISSSSSDMTGIPFLTLGYSEQGDNNVPDILGFTKSNLHTDFKLTSGGETLYLFDPSGEISDSVLFPALPRDISYGKLNEQSETWVMFKNPTPGDSNGGEIYNGSVPDSIVFSHESGFYKTSFSLTLSGADSIYYTLDATEPDLSAELYTGPVLINKNRLVKARIFKNGDFSLVRAKNYLFNANHSLPVISLNTEQDYLWDNDIGMYVLGDSYESGYPYFGANFWEDWEYPFNLNYFDQLQQEVINTGCGVKIFGGWSRAVDQKSFSLFARSAYGENSFKYPFFKTRPYAEFESVILRNGGNDWNWGLIRDVVMTSLLKGTAVDFQAYQPVVCYLNGAYWGLYNMREKISEHFIASLHDVDPDEVDLLELNGVIKHGDNSEYLELLSFIENNSLASQANYEYVISQIDELNFIQYYLSNIYYNNTDWPGNNIRFWKVPGGKWRWIMFDTDFGLNLYDANGHSNNTLAFALQSNGPAWPNPPWSTLFLRKLLANISFRQKFVNYFADAMNSFFLPEFATAHVDAVINGYGGEFSRHWQKWNMDSGFWQQNIDRINNFFYQRPNIMRSHIRSQFNLPASHLLTVIMNQARAGTIHVNSLDIELSEWFGYYFQNIPITVTAEPKAGYYFDGWTGDIVSDNQTLTINLSKATELIANFIPMSVLEQPVVINEINYNSPEDVNASDWVELHNFSDEIKDVSGWVFRDADDTHAFLIPANTTIEPKGFLILCRNIENFTGVYPDVEPYIGEFDFGLSAEGDAVKLYDSDGLLMDSVAYLPFDPWPVAANGNGPTLELISPVMDNALPESWKSFDGLGTPGTHNHFYSPDSSANDSPVVIYPNPGHNKLNLRLTENDAFIKTVRIYDNTGKLVIIKEIIGEVSEYNLDISKIERGVYIAMITRHDDSVTGRYFEKF